MVLVVNKWTVNEKSRGDEVGGLGLCYGEGEGLSWKKERVRNMGSQEKNLTAWFLVSKPQAFKTSPAAFS